MFEYLIAFGAGLISFLSPCVLPLIPGYISYISGQSLQEILNKKEINFFPLILFCLGFSTVFVLLGASASFLGQTLLQNSEILRIVAGIVIIIFSLQLIGIINIPYLNFEKRFDAKESRNILFPYISTHNFYCSGICDPILYCSPVSVSSCTVSKLRTRNTQLPATYRQWYTRFGTGAT